MNTRHYNDTIHARNARRGARSRFLIGYFLFAFVGISFFSLYWFVGGAS